MDFTDESFEGLDAARADWSERRYENCTFTACVLSDVSLRGASFIDCRFNDCNLSNAQLTNAVFRDVQFVDSKLVGLDWTTARTVASVKCERCVINYAIFENVDLRHCGFVDCTARETDFTSANLTETSLRGSDLAGARFVKTNLTKADLRGATSYLIDPLQNKLKGAKFTLPDAVALLHALGVEID